MTAQSHSTVPSLHKPSPYTTDLNQQAWEPRRGHRTHSHPHGSHTHLGQPVHLIAGTFQISRAKFFKSPWQLQLQLLGLSLGCVLAEWYMAVTLDGSQGNTVTKQGPWLLFRPQPETDMERTQKRLACCHWEPGNRMPRATLGMAWTRHKHPGQAGNKQVQDG